MSWGKKEKRSIYICLKTTFLLQTQTGNPCFFFLLSNCCQRLLSGSIFLCLIEMPRASVRNSDHSRPGAKRAAQWQRQCFQGDGGVIRKKRLRVSSVSTGCSGGTMRPETWGRLRNPGVVSLIGHSCRCPGLIDFSRKPWKQRVWRTREERQRKPLSTDGSLESQHSSLLLLAYTLVLNHPAPLNIF